MSSQMSPSAHWELEEQHKELERQQWVNAVRLRILTIVRNRSNNPMTIQIATELVSKFGRNEDSYFPVDMDAVDDAAVLLLRQTAAQIRQGLFRELLSPSTFLMFLVRPLEGLNTLKGIREFLRIAER